MNLRLKSFSTEFKTKLLDRTSFRVLQWKVTRSRRSLLSGYLRHVDYSPQLVVRTKI